MDKVFDKIKDIGLLLAHIMYETNATELTQTMKNVQRKGQLIGDFTITVKWKQTKKVREERKERWGNG